MRVLALDLSLAGTGIASTTGEGDWTSWTVKTEPKQALQVRLSAIVNAVDHAFEQTRPDILVAEALGMGHSGGWGGELPMVHGAVLHHLWSARSCVPWLVAPATLKKFVTGDGRADKKEVRAWIRKRWGMDFKDHNQADAHALCRLGYQMLLPEHELKDQNLLSVLSVRNSPMNGFASGLACAR